MALFQTTFWLSDQSVGGWALESAMPFPLGPRHNGQSSPLAENEKNKIIEATQVRVTDEHCWAVGSGIGCPADCGVFSSVDTGTLADPLVEKGSKPVACQELRMTVFSRMD